MRTLKVYGWHGYRLAAKDRHHQTREICAAPSKAAAARAAGKQRPDQLWNLSETGNQREVEAALQQPGVVLWRSLDDHRGEYQP